MTTIRETFLSRVVHCKQAPYDVYIGRPSKWGNPFIIGRDGTREEVIQKYVDHLSRQRQDLINELRELVGQVLGCWCAPKFCHGHILAALAMDIHICRWCGEPHIGGPEYCQP